jgi:hypothetical protein
MADLYVRKWGPAGEPGGETSKVRGGRGLPTLPTKLVEKVWNLEYVE